MFCPNCGKEVTPENNFCPNCGKEVNPFSDNNGQPVNNAQPTQPTPAVTTVSNTPDPNAAKYEKFAKTGFWLAIAQIVCFALAFIIAIGIVSQLEDLNNLDLTPYTSQLVWVGLFFIAAIILGGIAIIFSALAVGKQHKKSGMATAGLVLSIIFTLLCIITLISGS